MPHRHLIVVGGSTGGRGGVAARRRPEGFGRVW